MPQYERKTGYVVRVRPDELNPTHCFIAEFYDKNATEQFFAHKNDFRGRKVPPIGTLMEGTLRPLDATKKRRALMTVEVLTALPLEAA